MKEYWKDMDDFQIWSDIAMDIIEENDLLLEFSKRFNAARKWKKTKCNIKVSE